MGGDLAGRAAALPVLAAVIAAVQGIVLTAAVSGVWSRPVGMIALGVALLLRPSFGHDIAWLYRKGAGPAPARRAPPVRRGRGLIVWAALVAPDRLDL